MIDGQAPDPPPPSALDPAAAALQQALRTAPWREREALLVARMQLAVAKSLGHGSRLPDPRQGFFELGMDSLMVVEFKTTLEADLGLALPETLTFDHPTIETLAAHLARLFGTEEPPSPPAARPVETLERAIARLSDEEARKMLESELDWMKTRPGLRSVAPADTRGRRRE